MIQETIDKIEARIETVDVMQPENKVELRNLLSTLKYEVETLAHTQTEKAESIAAFADISTREATRSERNENLLAIALDGLRESVDEFQLSHPILAEAANQFCIMLNNVGM